MNVTSALTADDLIRSLGSPPPNLAAHGRSLDGYRDRDCFVIGDEGNRLLILADADHALFIASRPLVEHPFVVQSKIDLATPGAYVSEGSWSAVAYHRATTPNVFLVGLHHREHFPTVRFHLALGLLASAARSLHRGTVTLRDMQLGGTVTDLIEEIATSTPDIVGVSVTFGQADLLGEFLRALECVPQRPQIVVVGGSLAARNADLILGSYDDVIVCTGSGEATIRDLMRSSTGEIPLDEVRGIAFRRAGVTVHTPRVYDAPDRVPELDLLAPTLDRHGVMLLETTRGCTHACSFCPRDHKGRWQAGSPAVIDAALERVKPYYDDRPAVARRVFFADEEFIGRDRDSSSNEFSRSVAEIVSRHGFKFENSTRLDDVYDHRRPQDWNRERVSFWRYLARTSLNRMLFGVESGVESILRRFNKGITSADVVRGIRIVTACGAAVRLTYITFDPLMTLDELRRTYEFLGRKDLLLRRADELTDEELLDATGDDEYVKTLSLGRPLYDEVPYMLVSMECLIGSRYLAEVEDAGLAGAVNLQLGRRDASYQDWRIGVLSHASQIWIDRHFALDYALKGLEKTAHHELASGIRGVRKVLKGQAYELLGDMLLLAERTTLDSHPGGLTDRARHLLEERVALLRERLVPQLTTLFGQLSASDAELLREIATQWSSAERWELING